MTWIEFAEQRLIHPMPLKKQNRNMTNSRIASKTLAFMTQTRKTEGRP